MGISIHNLPDNVLELIFTHVNPYEDYNSIKLVSRRWYTVAAGTFKRMERCFKKCTNFSWHYVEGDHLLSERCSHAACYHPCDYAIYIFGGCTNTYTAFNDLWLFDLSHREWERVMITRPPLPSPKALASMVLYENNLLLFGGFSKSSMNPIHQTNTFYNELHLFNRISNCWEEIISENTAPHLAGHSASIVANFMLVFGGSMGSSYNNNVYVLDLSRRIWNMPTIPGPCPPPRYGQSQILIDDHHLIVIGGCGGPNLMYSDVWLLHFDLLGDAEWRWSQLKVENLELTPPFTWCHRAEKVGENAVIVSRPIKWHNPSTSRRSNRLGRRRTSSQSTSASGGSGRLASPDSPLDRKVAAAFCTGSFEHLHQQQRAKDGRGKPVLLTSRSLDDQQQRNNTSGGEEMMTASPDSSCKSLQNSPTTSVNLTVANSTFSTSLSTVHSQQKNAGELHRACSIPAIIVGEIPKLIVTASVEPTASTSATAGTKTVTLSNKPSPSINPTSSKKVAAATGSSKSRFDTLLNKTVGSHNSEHEIGSKSITGKDAKECSSANSSTDPEQIHTESSNAVREYYLSLVREEFHRLCIVEFSENLGSIDQRLERFLCERVGYLNERERMEIIVEFMLTVRGEKSAETGPVRRVASSGQLKNRKKISNLATEESHQPERIADEPPKSSSECTDSSIFATSCHRRLCVYILRLSDAVNGHRVRWEQLPVEEDAPEDKLLYSFVACRGELVLFGGMQSDGGGMESLNVGLERRSMSSETYILRPRYNEML